MKSQFVADGGIRFMMARSAASSEALQKKYAGELAKAGPLQKLRIRRQMLREHLRNGIAGHQPSAGTLW